MSTLLFVEIAIEPGLPLQSLGYAEINGPVTEFFADRVDAVQQILAPLDYMREEIGLSVSFTDVRDADPNKPHLHSFEPQAFEERVPSRRNLEFRVRFRVQRQAFLVRHESAIRGAAFPPVTEKRSAVGIAHSYVYG